MYLANLAKKGGEDISDYDLVISMKIEVNELIQQFIQELNRIAKEFIETLLQACKELMDYMVTLMREIRLYVPQQYLISQNLGTNIDIIASNSDTPQKVLDKAELFLIFIFLKYDSLAIAIIWMIIQSELYPICKEIFLNIIGF